MPELDLRRSAGDAVADIVRDVLPADFNLGLLPDVVSGGVYVLLGGSPFAAGLTILLPEVLAAITGGPTAQDIANARIDIQANVRGAVRAFQEFASIKGEDAIVPGYFDLPNPGIAATKAAFFKDCIAQKTNYLIAQDEDVRKTRLGWRRPFERAAQTACAELWERYKELKGITETGGLRRPMLEWYASKEADELTARYASNYQPVTITEKWTAAVYLEEMPKFPIFEQAEHDYLEYVKPGLTDAGLQLQLGELDRQYGMGRLSADNYRKVLNAVWGQEVFPGLQLWRFWKVDNGLAPEPAARQYLIQHTLPNEPAAPEPEREPKRATSPVVAGAAALGFLIIGE